MTFWLEVGLGYLLLLGVGLGIGTVIGGRPRGGGRDERQPGPLSPEPIGPTLALDCPPLGSAYDRMLLPDAFDELPTVRR